MSVGKRVPIDMHIINRPPDTAMLPVACMQSIRMYPQALCICPTRELVVQNLNVLERMAKFTSITATSTAATDSRFSRWTVVGSVLESTSRPYVLSNAQTL